MVRRKASATVNVSLRLKEPLRARLARSAKQRGVSLNRELVDRLERSLLEEDARRTEFGKDEYYNLARLVVIPIRGIESMTGLVVKDSPWLYRQWEKSIALMLAAFRPTGDTSPPEGYSEDEGEQAALGTLDGLRTCGTPELPNPGVHLGRNAAELPLIKEGLGSIMERLS